MSNEVSLTLRDMNPQVVRELKQQAKKMNLSPTKLIEALGTLFLCRINYTSDTVNRYLQQQQLSD